MNHLTLLDSTMKMYTGDILYPFALDEVWARKVGQGLAAPGFHLWRHEKAFVLGLRDRKLPYALEAMDELEKQGYAVTVRNSGGAAVPLDPGVVNLSIILPNPTAKLDFNQDFEKMFQLIRDSLGPFVEKGEVEGSYCPGDFDLSIQGKKFCGIAQRRQTKAFVVQAFIVVEGEGRKRAELVRQFYDIATGGQTGLNHPLVEKGSMGSLQDLASVESVSAYLANLVQVLQGEGVALSTSEVDETWLPEIQATLTELRERYEKRG
ncbi:biotin--protein ligase [Ammoniphilus sp. YIM 78166]|uniref:lipoate--protein ligase family protein n=1 Tax=Ammoniphilus sp. YIM 78166 TaxID=1644106 RepID=UPI0010703BEA|nr:biotin--protein ligase [Ammoniphilus sp. YIM 78166]